MLHQFSWQHFLVAAFALSLCWYAGLFLFFYRDRRRGKSGGKGSGFFAGKGTGTASRTDEPSGDRLREDDLVGKPRLPEGMSRLGSEELLFAGGGDRVDKVRQLGQVPDLIEELKEIFRVLEAERGTKEDFMELFALMRAKFPGMSGTPAINAFIREHVLFPLSDAELEALWG